MAVQNVQIIWRMLNHWVVIEIGLIVSNNQRTLSLELKLSDNVLFVQCSENEIFIRIAAIIAAVECYFRLLARVFSRAANSGFDSSFASSSGSRVACCCPASASFSGAAFFSPGVRSFPL